MDGLLFLLYILSIMARRILAPEGALRIRRTSLLPIRRPDRPLRYLFNQPVYRDVRLRIRGIGIREAMPPCRMVRPEGTGDYFFLLFHTRAEARWDGAWKHAPPGAIIFWERAAGHFYGNACAPWLHSWIHCDGREVKDILASARVKRNRLYATQDPLRLQDYLSDLHDEISSQRRPNPTIVRNTLSNLVQEAVRSDRRPAPAPEPESLSRARDRLDIRYADKMSLADLASEAGLSPPHFCTAFRQYFGRPPLAYLTSRRMRVAEALLRGTTASIGDIGRQVGYHDPYYFSKHFKGFFGFAPSTLRSGPKRGGTGSGEVSGNSLRHVDAAGT
jgi:AraC-like DNA-binding protein